MLEVIAEAAAQSNASDGWIALAVPLLIVAVKAWLADREARAAKTDAERADAEARRNKAVAEAVIVGVEAYKKTLPDKAKRAEVSAAITAKTTALGVEEAVEPIVRRLTGTRPVVDADGTPRLVDGSGDSVKPPPLAAFLFFALVLLPAGCVATEQRATAEALHGRLALLRAASEPHHDYDEAGRAAWARLWSKALGASRALVESTGGNAAAAEQAAYEEARVAAGASGEVR